MCMICLYKGSQKCHMCVKCLYKGPHNVHEDINLETVESTEILRSICYKF